MYTFKDYLEDSKRQLQEAAKKTPVQTTQYKINKYCKLPVQEFDGVEHVNLKPTNYVEVDWLFEDMNNPEPLNVRFVGVKEINHEANFEPKWNKLRFQKWLLRNSKGVTQ